MEKFIPAGSEMPPQKRKPTSDCHDLPVKRRFSVGISSPPSVSVRTVFKLICIYIIYIA